MANPGTVFIADDYKIFRDGVKVGLQQDDNFQVVLEADNGEDLCSCS
jgi:DNA-binding NarL/FixJ family response regulator